MLGVFFVEGVDSEGRHLLEWAYRLQTNNKTLTVAPRKHLKTTLALGYLAWQLYKMDRPFTEWEYMSYTEDLAAHQLKRGKRILRAIPGYFDDFKDITDAEGIWRFKKDGCEFVCEPSGIMTFKRGRHPHGSILDDVLRDPRSMMQLSVLNEITRVFNEEIESMPTDELHVFGTPQHDDDLFTVIEKKAGFNCRRYQSVINYTSKEVLWPEVFPFDRCEEIRKSIGDKAFSKEYQCQPVHGAEGYFSQQELDSVIFKRLKNQSPYKEIKLREYTYGGLDIGKRQHPSHISLYGKDRQKRLVQLISIWLDGVDYVEQLSICKEIVKNYKVHRFYYDDTRAELEGFKEIGDLPAQMKGVCFTKKMKFQIAVEFEKAVKTHTILMLADIRQKRQILNVDNDLKSMETPEGHGDSFWSNALAIQASRDTGPNIRFL